MDLSYEQVTEDPEKWVEKLIHYLDLEVTGEQYQEALDSVLPKERIRKLSQEVQTKARIEMIKKAVIKPWKIPGFIFRKIRSKIP